MKDPEDEWYEGFGVEIDVGSLPKWIVIFLTTFAGTCFILSLIIWMVNK